MELYLDDDREESMCSPKRMELNRKLFNEIIQFHQRIPIALYMGFLLFISQHQLCHLFFFLINFSSIILYYYYSRKEPEIFRLTLIMNIVASSITLVYLNPYTIIYLVQLVTTILLLNLK